MEDFLNEVLGQADSWTEKELEDMREAHECKHHNSYDDCYYNYIDKGISPYDLF